MDLVERERTAAATDGAECLARARRLAPQLAAAGDEIEQRGELPAHLVATLIQSRFFRLLQPRSLGGVELDPVSYVQVVEEVAGHDASTA